MTDYYDLGYNLKDCLIYPASGSKTAVSVLLSIIEINVYEDLFSPYLTGNIIIQDAHDLSTNIPIVGFEFLVLKFGKPQDTSGVEDFIKTFRIYKPEIPDFDFGNQSNQTYVLRFASEEALLSASTSIFKSYKGKSATQIVKDVTKNFLKVSSKKYQDKNFEDSIYKTDYISYWRPFELISWISNRTSPPFIFFENSEGFNFKKIDTLMGQKPSHNYYFSTQNIPPDNTTTLSRVTKFEFMHNYDSLKGIQNGLYASNLTTIDPVRRRLESFNLSYKDYFNKITTLGDAPFFSEYDDRFGKSVYENFDAHRKFMVDNKDHDTDPLITSVQPNINPYRIDQWLLQRISRIEQLDFFKLKMVIPGDLRVTVGDKITFGLPRADMKDASKNYLNPYHTGEYLITAVRHKINFKSYEMILEATRDSVSTNYPSVDNTDTNLDGFRKA